jgi:hypothetical protein
VYHCNCIWHCTRGKNNNFEHCNLMEDLLRNNNMRGSVMVQCNGEIGTCEYKFPKPEWFANAYTIEELIKNEKL